MRKRARPSGPGRGLPPRPPARPQEVPPRPGMQLEQAARRAVSRLSAASAAFCAPRPPGRTRRRWFLPRFFSYSVCKSRDGGGRQEGPMCGRIASGSTNLYGFWLLCSFGQRFCPDFLRIITNSPLFPGCLKVGSGISLHPRPTVSKRLQ